MKIEATKIADVKLITPQKFGDERGFFSETYKANVLAEAGIGLNFIQDNHAFSQRQGVLRGLHFQWGKNVQAKLIRCTKGAILDVAVDIRHGSPSFGHHVAVELCAKNWHQLLVPHGFAHAYCTLTPDAEVQYKVDGLYDPDHEGAVRWDDPALAIDWPINSNDVTLSEKDKVAPLLKESPVYFRYKKGHGLFNCLCLDAPE